MSSDFRWRPQALVGLFCAAFCLGWRHHALNEDENAVTFSMQRCDVAFAIGDAVLCEVDSATAAGECALGAQSPISLWPGDALVCDAQIGWQVRGRMSARAIDVLKVPIDLNRASLEEMMSLPYVGEKRASQWINARPFVSWQAVDGLPGIGPRRLADVQRRGMVAGDEAPCIGMLGHAMWCAMCQTLMPAAKGF